jgi:nucleotide-binding universal stress UspA family protein
MPLKDILVRLDHTTSGLTRLKQAAGMARRHGARLTGLYVLDESAHQQVIERAGQMGLASAADMSAMAARIAKTLTSRVEETRKNFEQELQNANLHGEWRCHEGSASDITAYQVRYSDICIMGQRPCDDETLPLLQESTERTILLSGRPVLMVPPKAHCEALGRKLVVGWDASRAAGRSVNDALAIIEGADTADIVVIDPVADELAHGQEPGADIAEHLARHNCRVNVVRLEKRASVADTLCHHALKTGADLVIAGCYGHSRIGEWLLGGTTRALLRQATMPVLMSF